MGSITALRMPVRMRVYTVVQYWFCCSLMDSDADGGGGQSVGRRGVHKGLLD